MRVPTLGPGTRRTRGVSSRAGAIVVASNKSRTNVPCLSATISRRTFLGSDIKTTSAASNSTAGTAQFRVRACATVAFLAGSVVCGQCGCRMQTRYTRCLRYVCQRRALDYAASPCQSLAGTPLEQLVGELVLQVVRPAGLELSLRTAQECECVRAALDRQ